MPSLTDLAARPKRLFSKKSYRPWNLGGENLSQIEATETSATVPDEPFVDEKSTNKFVTKNINFNRSLPLKNDQRKEAEAATSATSYEEYIESKSTVPFIREIHLQRSGTFIIDHDAFNPMSLKSRLESLSSIQSKIVNFLLDICLKNNLSETGPLKTEVMCQYIETAYPSVKTSIHRLIKNGIIRRNKGKPARYGYINLSFPDEVMEIISDIRLRKEILQSKGIIPTSTQLTLDTDIHQESVIDHRGAINEKCKSQGTSS
jgi:hypothetical protein